MGQQRGNIPGDNVQGSKPTAEQEKTLRDILSAIGPVYSMQFFSTWLTQASQSGHYGSDFRDQISKVVPVLQDATSTLRGQTG